MRRTPKNRGFTLLEMLMGVIIGSIVVLAAVAIAGHQVRTLGISSQLLEVTQVGRTVLDMLADDLTNAGAGVGYIVGGDAHSANPHFEGVVIPAAPFVRNNRAIALASGAASTDDLTILVADGATASIVGSVGGGYVICSPGPDEVAFGTIVDERVILRDAFALGARSAILNVVNPAVPCPAATACLAAEIISPGLACTQVAITEEVFFGTTPWGTDALALDVIQTPLAYFNSGSITGNFREITWYIEGNGSEGRLRRAVNNVAGPCLLVGDSPNCGDVAAEGVEALHYAVYQLTPPATWTLVPGAILTANPIRVDLELVVRGRSLDINGTNHEPGRIRLDGTCIPATCAPNPLRRETFRTSVEVKNSGYMRLNGGVL